MLEKVREAGASGFSRAEPTWYQTFTVTSGTRVILVQDDGSPFGSVNCVYGTVRAAGRGPARTWARRSARRRAPRAIRGGDRR